MTIGEIIIIALVAGVWAVGLIIRKLQNRKKIGFTSKEDAEHLKNSPQPFIDPEDPDFNRES